VCDVWKDQSTYLLVVREQILESHFSPFPFESSSEYGGLSMSHLEAASTGNVTTTSHFPTRIDVRTLLRREDFLQTVLVNDITFVLRVTCLVFGDIVNIQKVFNDSDDDVLLIL
jgi:hypothetical protein